MGGRVKVIELAKELGVTSKDLLVALEGMGHKGKRAMSPLDQAMANQLRLQLGRGRELPTETKPKRTTRAAKAQELEVKAAPQKRAAAAKEAAKKVAPAPVPAEVKEIAAAVAPIKPGEGSPVEVKVPVVEPLTPAAQPEPKVVPIRRVEKPAAAVASAPLLERAPAAPAAPPRPAPRPAAPGRRPSPPKPAAAKDATISAKEVVPPAVAAPPHAFGVGGPAPAASVAAPLATPIAAAPPLSPPPPVSAPPPSQGAPPAPAVEVKRELLRLPESVTVAELAEKMRRKSGELIKALLEMGVMATLNEILDPTAAKLVADKFNFYVELTSLEGAEMVE